MSSCSLPLVLLVLICVQSFTLAQDPKEPDICCFTFQKRKVPEQLITKYKETDRDCPNPGIIFIMKSGRRVCADPTDQWVKEHMDNVDLRLYADTKQTYTERPEPCCFSFQRNNINVDDINVYKITHSNCSNAGIHFIMKNGHHVCADPKDHWVKNHMDAIDHRHVAKLMQSQHLNPTKGERPELCCYKFWMSEIPSRVITGYKETHSACQKPGIIFFLKNDRHVCADPGVHWVKEHISN